VRIHLTATLSNSVVSKKLIKAFWRGTLHANFTLPATDELVVGVRSWGDVFFQFFNESCAIFVIACGGFKGRVQRGKIAVYVVDEQFAEEFADHRCQRDGQEFIVCSYNKMEFHIFIFGTEVVTAEGGVLAKYLQLHIGEHTLKDFSVFYAAALPVDDDLQVAVGEIFKCFLNELTGRGEQDGGFIFYGVDHFVVVSDVEAGRCDVEGFDIIGGQVVI